MSRRRRAIIVACALVLALLLVLRGTSSHTPWNPRERTPTAELPSMQLSLAPAPAPGPISDGLEAWAQAIAYHGQHLDGRRPEAPEDPAIRALDAPVAAVIAAQPWSDWRRLQAQAADAPIPPDLDQELEHTAARRVQPLAPDPTAAITERGGLHLDNAATTSLRLPPTATQPFVLHAPERALVVRIAPGPGAGLRLDGGLVIPGRFYLLRSRSELRTALPVGIEIRPAAAVDRFHPEPIAPPPGDG